MANAEILIYVGDVTFDDEDGTIRRDDTGDIIEGATEIEIENRPVVIEDGPPFSPVRSVTPFVWLVRYGRRELLCGTVTFKLKGSQ